jgi:bidirectional [NiFe] hydrogenase diaphorase subunit
MSGPHLTPPKKDDPSPIHAATPFVRGRKVTVKACRFGFHSPGRSAVRSFTEFLLMNATLASPHKKRLQSVLDHASGDKRFKILEVHMKRHQFRHDSLIEVLHKAQELFGYLEDDLLLFVSYKLKLPPSRVYGVATFYHFFTLKPQGEHTCVVCMGTACYVKGADKVIASVQARLKIKPGETTPDNRVSLLTARCIGACGIAPAVVYDGTVTPRQSPETAVEHLKQWEAK